MTRLIRLTLTIARGLALNQRQRRKTMFALTIAVLGMVFVGAFLLWNLFAAHPLFFAIFWLVCVWLVACVVLLAIYDLVMVLRRGREEYAAARREIFHDRHVQNPRKDRS